MAFNRALLERNIEYHQSLADYYEAHLPEGSEAPKEGNGRRRHHQQQPPRADATEVLHKLHAEVAAQLREVLGSEPQQAIIQAMATRPVRRRALVSRLVH